MHFLGSEKKKTQDGATGQEKNNTTRCNNSPRPKTPSSCLKTKEALKEMTSK